ncbi:hypothetical protein [Pseudarthrobacter sp. PS3-L1]|uniref:hypothetical protein n=1 Tax=Pseudarthrobacter sp. PS3-L1 TaxID=3046207 RepID=UPI0024B8B827|nr:hypothetical protein [Pseudarthrobacter sp. PS3-L1]MDJ0320997.1 hypothetical protein [Pseudarthrobacter sp. PS3-L1]
MTPFIYQASEATGVYWTKMDVVFLPPPGAAAGNPLRLDSQDIVQYAALIQRLAIRDDNQPVQETNGATLYGTGIRDGHSVYLPNSGGQWQPSFDRAVVSIEVVAETPEKVATVTAELATKIENASQEQQDRMGISEKALITTDLSPTAPSISYHPAKPKFAVGALVLLALGLAGGASSGAERLTEWLRNRRRERMQSLHQIDTRVSLR